MGYHRIVFDIETAPLLGAEEYLEPVEAPANYKDESKIAAYIEEKRGEQLSKCSLDVDLCRVVAIGSQAENEDDVSADVAKGDEFEERSLIAAFWSRIGDNDHLVGFNCLGFDLPVLLRRSLYLGIRTPLIQIDRFKHPRVTDLMQVLSFNGVLKFRGLSFYARRFGFPSTDELTGAEIAMAVQEQRWDDVLAHVTADVSKTVLLAERLGHFERQFEAPF